MDTKWETQRTKYGGEDNPNWRGGKEVPCTQCGKLIWRRPSDIKRVKNTFCSPGCHDEFRRKPPDPDRLKREEMKGKNHPRWKGPMRCKVCGTELLERRQRQQEHCFSESCRKESRRRGVVKAMESTHGPDRGRATFVCQHCGREIEARASVARRRKFCSYECRSRSGVNLKFEDTAIEKAVQEALDELGLGYETQHSPPGAPGPYDLYVADRNLLIEVDGEFWHRSEWAMENTDIEDRDRRKTEWAESHGYEIVRLKGLDIREKGASALLAGLEARP